MSDADLLISELNPSASRTANLLPTAVVHAGRGDGSMPATKAKAARDKSPMITAATVHGAGNTVWWFDARGVSETALLLAVEKSNCTHILIARSQLEALNTRKQRVIWVEHQSELDGIPPAMKILTSNETIRDAAIAAGHKAGLLLKVSDLQAGFPACVELCTRGDDFSVIDIEHATYIPYELLIAKAEHTGTQILRSVPIRGLENAVGEVDQSLNALATMEQGVGVLLRTDDVNTVRSMTALLRSRQSVVMPLVEAEVVEVRHTGLGHRVCVDTTSLMTAEEGIIVGSTGWGGLFICSETHFLPHMNLREFRVNAGGVHSYVWTPEGTALYLSEIQAGSEVLCVNKDGSARVVAVGRAKIERRPLLKIVCRVSLDQLSPQLRDEIQAAASGLRDVTAEGGEVSAIDERYVYINTFLQNDWHVRVMGADGVVRHDTLLRRGDRLLAHIDKPGRHTGLRVTEHIVEK